MVKSKHNRGQYEALRGVVIEYMIKPIYETAMSNGEHEIESTASLDDKVSTGTIKIDKKKVSTGAICVDFN